MRILQIAPPWIDTPPKAYGGTELIIGSLSNGLAKMGHKVTLFATGNSETIAKLKYAHKKSLYDQNVPWNAGLPVLLHYFEAAKLAKKHWFNIVHLHLSSQTDLAVLPLISEIKTPVVATLHCPIPLDQWTHMDEEYLNRYAKKVYAINISNYMATISPPQMPSAGVVYNSVDPSLYTFNPLPGKYLAWLGRIFPYKGLHIAIAAAKRLGEQLVFAGTVDKQVPESGNYFEKQIKPHIDGKHIIYLGPANLAVKNELLSNAKAFLNPITWEEPFGLVMIEAGMCGTPVLAFRRGAAPEVIEPGKTGYLVNSLDELTARLDDAVKLSRSTVRETVARRFNTELMTKNYLAAYRYVLEQSRLTLRQPFLRDSINFRLPKLADGV